MVRVLALTILLGVTASCKTVDTKPQASSPIRGKSHVVPPAGIALVDQKNPQVLSKALTLEGGGTRMQANEVQPSLPSSNAKLDPSSPQFIRSCVLTTSAGTTCLQNASATTLFFCGGLPSKSACNPQSYTMSCRQTVPVNQRAGNPVQSAAAQVVLLFLSKNSSSKRCDAGSLMTL